jgi:predicted phosphoribosyltransferase
VVCLAEPPGFRSVGEHYAEFPQVDDDEVVAALRAAARPAA